MLSNEFIASLRNKYNTSIDDFDLKLSGTQITCSVVDSNGIKSKLGYVISDTSTEKEIDSWVCKIVNSINNIRRLNEKSNGEYAIKYAYVINKETLKKSYVYDWDYNGIVIALSINSIELLNNSIDELLSEVETYDSFKSFIENYIAKDKVVSSIGIEFNSKSVDNNIYDILGYKAESRNSILSTIRNYKNKTGKIKLKSSILSESLGILAKVVWEVDFSNMDIKIYFDENKIFYTEYMDFIRDPEILNGLLKIYKPNLTDIFE